MSAYVVFEHVGHVLRLPDTLTTIQRWEPGCGLKLAEVLMFERYAEKFNPLTSDGEIEIWVPLGV